MDITNTISELDRLASSNLENIDFDQAALDALRACCEQLEPGTAIAHGDQVVLARAMLRLFEKFPNSTGCGLFQTLGMIMEEFDEEMLASEIASSRARTTSPQVEELAATLGIE